MLRAERQNQPLRLRHPLTASINLKEPDPIAWDFSDKRAFLR